VLAFDGPPELRMTSCTSCGAEYPLITAFVVQGADALAVVYAACHAHDDRTEAWLDIAIGSFDEPDFADQATFSFRVRSEGATLFQGPVAADGRASFFGKKLTVDEAKEHHRLLDAWAVVDFVVTTEPTISASVYGSPSA
jgi:hypothetical protein